MNKYITDLVEEWSNLDPIWRKFFSHKNTKSLLEACDIVTEGFPKAEKIIERFVYGLASIPIYEDLSKEDQSEIDRMLNPVIKSVIRMVKSESYQKGLIKDEISGLELLTIDGVTTPIVAEELLLQIKRSKSMPLVPKDIAKIKSDLIDYKREQHSDRKKARFKYPYDRAMILRVYEYCNKKVFECELDEYIGCIVYGDFSQLVPLSKAKTKIPSLIKNLATIGGMSDEWYSKSVESIGLKKKDCSGKPISEIWSEGLENAIKNKQKK